MTDKQRQSRKEYLLFFPIQRDYEEMQEEWQSDLDEIICENERKDDTVV